MADGARGRNGRRGIRCFLVLPDPRNPPRRAVGQPPKALPQSVHHPGTDECFPPRSSPGSWRCNLLKSNQIPAAAAPPRAASSTSAKFLKIVSERGAETSREIRETTADRAGRGGLGTGVSPNLGGTGSPAPRVGHGGSSQVVEDTSDLGYLGVRNE